MITIVAGLAAIFVAVVVFFILLKNPGKIAIVVTGMTTIALCWGLVDWQMTNRLEAIICPYSADNCSVNLSRIYQDPVLYDQFVQTSWYGSMNMKWGWIVWTAFFLIAYAVARRARKQLARASSA